MRDKKMYFVLSILWAVVAVWWIIDLFIDFFLTSSSVYLIVLHGLTAVMSCFAAIVCFWRCRKNREENN